MATSLDWLDLEFWWELAALVTIMLLGHWQEMKAIGQAQNALAALAALLPDEAELVDGDDDPTGVAIDELQVGDVVLVRPGARVPADGTIVDGGAELDESMITGESKPVTERVGDRVVAGTVSTDSSIRVRVDAVGDDTALAGIQRLVADAQASQSRAQVLADRFAALLFYVAVAAGVVTFVVWWAIGDSTARSSSTVTVLVIACPHALGLAIPLVIALSTAVSAKAGILVKDRLALERMRSIDTVLFDKTGTLTKGAHVVTGVAGTDRSSTTTGCCDRRSRRGRQRTPARPGDRRRRRRQRPRPGDRLPVDHRARRHRRHRRQHLRRRRPGAAAPTTTRRSRGAPRRHRRMGAARRRRALPAPTTGDRRRHGARGRDPTRSPPSRRRAAPDGRRRGDDHRRRPPGRRSRRPRPRHRQRVRRGAPRGQGPGRLRPPAARR